MPRATKAGWRREAGGSRAVKPPRATPHSAYASLPRAEGLHPAVRHRAGGPLPPPPPALGSRARASWPGAGGSMSIKGRAPRTTWQSRRCRLPCRRHSGIPGDVHHFPSRRFPWGSGSATSHHLRRLIVFLLEDSRQSRGAGLHTRADLGDNKDVLSGVCLPLLYLGFQSEV